MIVHAFFFIALIVPRSAISEDIKFYVADELSHTEKTIGVDACDINPYSDNEEKTSSPLPKPIQLYLLTDSGPKTLAFQKIKRKTYLVCDSHLPRNIWVWKSKESPKSIPLLSSSKNVQFKLLDANFKSYQVTQADLSRMISINKRWAAPDSFKTCSAFKWDRYLRFDCRNFAYLFMDYKLLDEVSDPDKGIFLNLVGSVKFHNEEYFFIAYYNEPSRPLKDRHPFVLKTASGKTIYPEGCDLPSGC